MAPVDLDEDDEEDVYEDKPDGDCHGCHLHSAWHVITAAHLR